MKLYDVPDNTRVRMVGQIKVPPGAPAINVGDELLFRNIDGMYSYCKDLKGNIVHLAAWAEVEIIN